MAWISVHESVDGSKLRELHKRLGCSKFEALGILNFLWFWGLSNADKDGLILHVDREDVERYLYGAGAGCKLSTKAILDALFETGWLDQIPDGIYIHDWEVWQEQWYKARERRENDAKRKRDSRKKPISTENAEKKDIPPENPSDNPADNSGSDSKKDVTSSNSPGETQYTTAFTQFWDVYPRKIGKGEAYKKYKARKNDGYSDEELITAAKNYALQVKKLKTDKQYIKHPKTFLSDTLPFTDFLPRKTEQKPAETASNDGNPFANWEGGN